MSSGGSCSPEKRLYCIRQSVGSHWREARRSEIIIVSLGNSQEKASSIVLSLFVCLKETENRRELLFKAHEIGRDKTFCSISGQKKADGTNATEFKIS